MTQGVCTRPSPPCPYSARPRALSTSLAQYTGTAGGRRDWAPRLRVARVEPRCGAVLGAWNFFFRSSRKHCCSYWMVYPAWGKGVGPDGTGDMQPASRPPSCGRPATDDDAALPRGWTKHWSIRWKEHYW